MYFQGLFGIKKVKIQHTDGQSKRCDNFKELYGTYIEESHKKIGKHKKQRMVSKLREIPT